MAAHVRPAVLADPRDPAARGAHDRDGRGILSLPITFGLRFALEGATDSTWVITVGTVFIAALASVVVGTLTTPFSAGANTLLYIDQRIRREALDVQLVRAAQSGA